MWTVGTYERMVSDRILESIDIAMVSAIAKGITDTKKYKIV